jgi:hypothetical protein
MAFQASTVAHSKAAGSWIKTDGFAFLPINTVWDQYPPENLTFVPNCCLVACQAGRRLVRFAKHTPVVSSLKRRFCDNGTKLMPCCFSPPLTLLGTV